MRFVGFSIALLALFHFAQCIQYTPIRQIKSGQVRGVILNLGNGKNLELYEGIKYGEANRFEKSQPARPWTGIYEATKPRDACPQFGFPAEVLEALLGIKSTAEDCLYLNIWRPVEEKANRPVMVWIHGGAFEQGTAFSETYNASNIAATGDLIVVSINYRLGPLGFLTGGGVPGNLGLFDQLLALKWVQENIHAFGGDRKQVTIFGESAGSMSVASMVISPLARGLFSRAIAQSGAPTRDSITEPLDWALAKTKAYAVRLNCSVSESLTNETIHCLKGKSVKQLQEASLNDLSTHRLFVPVFGDEFLPIKPVIALKAGQFNPVDYIYGVTRNEGTGFLPYFFPEFGNENLNLTIKSAKDYISKLMITYNLLHIGKEVADFYIDRLPSNSTSDDLKVAIGDAWADANMVCPSILFGEELAKQSPMTKHLYSYRLMQHDESILFGWQKWMGVTHGSDVPYLFAIPTANHSRSFTELSQKMVLDWTSFARTGRPHSSTWQESFNRQTDDFTARYFHLEAGHYKMVNGYYRETCEKFWKAKIFI